MASLTRSFERVKFPRTVINACVEHWNRELIDAGLIGQSSSEQTPNGTNGWVGATRHALETDVDSWDFDTLDEFYDQYRNDFQNAHLAFVASVFQNDDSPYSLGPLAVRHEFLRSLDIYTYRDHSRVTMEANSPAIILRYMGKFDEAAENLRTPAPPPTPPPPAQIFIGHGRAPDWRELYMSLNEWPEFTARAFETGAREGHTVRDVLQSELDRATFAILVLTAEDEQDDGRLRARQNVIHEAGLFQGRLGWDKAIMLVEEGVEHFSNASGVVHIPFQHGQIGATLGALLRVFRREDLV